ncbi:hypothetical protein GW17_00060156, partial [Ensete ventricosum]
VVFPTSRVEHFNPGASKTSLRENLDLVEELRAEAHLWSLHYRMAIARLYNRKVRPRLVNDNDLVLRKAVVNDPKHSHDMLALRWEGPYVSSGPSEMGLTP